ncbi:unnamed protein product [Gadus morhua 'NCC']
MAVSCGQFETVDLLRPRQWKHCLPSLAAELGCGRQRCRFTTPMVLRPFHLNKTPRRNVNKMAVPQGQGALEVREYTCDSRNMCGLSPPPPQRLITTSRPAWGAMDGPVSSLTLHASPRPCDKSTLSPHAGLHSTTDNPVTMETWMDRWRRGGAEVGSVDDSD